jgi:hypothetical protein
MGAGWADNLSSFSYDIVLFDVVSKEESGVVLYNELTNNL